MADIQSSGNGSSGKRTNDPAPRSCSLLKPSAFAPTSSFQPMPAPAAGNLSSNPFATSKLPAGSPSEGSINQQQHEPENPTPNKFFLRPSALDKHTSNLFKDSNLGTPVKTNSFKLEPPKLFSPFSVTNSIVAISSDKEKPKTDIDADAKNDGADNAAKGDVETKNNQNEDEPNAGQTEIPTDSADGSESNAKEKGAFIFGEMMEDRATAVASNTGIAASPSKSSGDFIFGKNIEYRAVVPPRDESTHSDDKTNETENSTSPNESEAGAGPSSLSIDAAKIVAKSEENRLEFKPVEVITGEEKESNVFQFNAKLYIFDKDSQSWVERGRGLLRLNDRTEDSSRPFQSRLVMRTQGSLRVILNTMIWSGMVVDKASPKNLQITAVDGEDGVKIFLITANPNDAEQMYSAIMSRVQQLKVVDISGKQPAKEPSSTSLSAAARKRSVDQDSCSSSSDACKRQKVVDQDQRREQTGEESNDSSALYPETEASNEGFASSPTIRSSSSSSDA